MGTFAEKLQKASHENNSLLCVGLDPEPSFIPDPEVVNFNRVLIEATADIACAYKTNLAIYEAMGKNGLEALEQTLETIRGVNPEIPIIGDAKRADIGNCSLAYAHNLFDNYKFDAVTVNPYMGSDSVAPFLERKDKGIFVLCRTSNPGGQDLQELTVISDGDSRPRPFYEAVAELARQWNANDNVGLIVGATYPQQIRRVRQICPGMIFLIPGVGAQGGDIRATVSSVVDADGAGFIISVSRQIMHAAKTAGGKLRTNREARRKLREVSRNLRTEINRQLTISMEQHASVVSEAVGM